METPELGIAELTESVIRAGTDTGYRISRDEAGRLQITAVDDIPVEPPLTFAATER